MKGDQIKRLAHLSLYLEVDGTMGRIMWIRPVLGTTDIFEASLEFEHSQGRGYQTWFIKGEEPICCSMYLSPDTQAIRIREEAYRAGYSSERVIELLKKG